jgi:nitrate reductase NapE component
MGLLASALGLFYVVAAYLALRQTRLEWFLDNARAALTNKETPMPERSRLYFVVLSACLYGLAGIALVIRSRFAVWFFVMGIAAQAIYYGNAWWRADEPRRKDNERWRKALNAAMISSAAFAFSAYAARQGILT